MHGIAKIYDEYMDRYCVLCFSTKWKTIHYKCNSISATVVLLVDSQNNSSDSENKSLQKHKFTSAYLYYIILGVGSR